MKDAIAKIKTALATNKLVPQLDHYLIQDGMLKASNGGLIAATPIDIKGALLLPGAELEKIVARFDKPKITITENEMKFKEGRFSAKLRLPPLDSIEFASPGEKWGKVPADLIPALARAKPFVATNDARAWAAATCLEDGLIWATNNNSMVKIACKGLRGAGQLFPIGAIEYLVQQPEHPKGMILTDSYAAFSWEDGSWMRTQLIVGEFPKNAEQILAGAVGIAARITPEWREAYQKVAALSEHDIHIYADKITGGKDHSDVEYEIKSAVPDGGVSVWSGKFLGPVLDACTHMAFDAWPNPAQFNGEGLTGVVVGRSK